MTMATSTPLRPYAKERQPASAFLLASFLAGYPDDQFARRVGAILADKQLSADSTVSDPQVWFRVRRKVEKLITSGEKINDLRSEYIEIFDHGRQHASLYETEYGRDRPLAKGNELADIAGFYRAFGLEFGDEEGVREMLDHVAVELEFYTLLLMKQEALQARGDEEGQTIVFEARKKFLEAHLGRFLGAIAKRPGVSESEFYGPVFTWSRDLVTQECERLGIEITPLDWLDTPADHEQMNCGGSCSLLGREYSPILSK